MANSKKPNDDYHVVPRGDQWAVQRAGGDRASSIKPTQGDAINVGRDLARNTGGELRIHRPNGQIRNSDSYGNDPNPPKDTKH